MLTVSVVAGNILNVSTKKMGPRGAVFLPAVFSEKEGSEKGGIYFLLKIHLSAFSTLS